MCKRSATLRFSMVTMMVLAIPIFAAAQHRGGAGVSAPAFASHPAAATSRAAAPAGHVGGHFQSRAQSAARLGTPIVRTRNGVRARSNNNINSGFNGTNFSNVPGLGFDYPHLAAISGNRRMHGGRFGGGFPFGFSGFLLNPYVGLDDSSALDSQPAD